MEFRDQQDDEIGVPSSSLGYNPSPSIRGSAFSKPTLSPSSCLVPPRGGAGAVGAAGGTARNGGIFASTTTPPQVNPSPVIDHHSSHTLGKSPDPAVVSNSSPTGVSAAAATSNTKNSSATAKTSAIASSAADVSFRYRECLRNHAASIGGNVVDGCGEFMPNGDPSTAEALKCAACGCHRSFHRKEVDGDGANAASSFYRGSSATRLPLLLPPPHPQVHHHSHHPHPKQFHLSGFPSSPSRTVPGLSGVVAFGGNTSGSGGTTTESSSEERINALTPTLAVVPKKRFRTKFTPEQKEKMLAFAERVGWRIQKQDEALVEQFCAEVGVRRQVLKVWMHNNKHTIRKQQDPQQDQLLVQQHQQMQSSLHPQQ